MLFRTSVLRNAITHMLSKWSMCFSKYQHRLWIQKTNETNKTALKYFNIIIQQWICKTKRYKFLSFWAFCTCVLKVDQRCCNLQYIFNTYTSIHTLARSPDDPDPTIEVIVCAGIIKRIVFSFVACVLLIQRKSKVTTNDHAVTRSARIMIFH